jgi:hypothetical protein
MAERSSGLGQLVAKGLAALFMERRERVALAIHPRDHKDNLKLFTLIT